MNEPLGKTSAQDRKVPPKQWQTFYQITRHQIPYDSFLHNHGHENTKYHTDLYCKVNLALGLIN
jgi:hypothetical protein